MKRFIAICLLFCVCLSVRADGTNQMATTNSIIEQCADYRVVQCETTSTNEFGQPIYRTHTYVELETGMAYADGTGQMRATEEEILPSEDGAIAAKGQHKVSFASELKTSGGSVDLLLHNGQRLKSAVLGISYFDTATGQSVLIAETQESEAVIEEPNKLYYRNAFTDQIADIRYTYTKGGMEQDILFLEQFPAPSAYGLSNATTKLQVLTEFFDPPSPSKQTLVRGGLNVDEIIDFGPMAIHPGYAFMADDGIVESSTVKVDKQWVRLEGRDFLVEQVDYTTIQSYLDELPEPEGAFNLEPRNGSVVHRVAKTLLLPAKREAKAVQKKPAKVAQARLRGKAFVLDYVILLSQVNFTFRSDITYYITNTVNLSGTTTIEGGAVMKFTNSPAAKINILGSIACKTGPYRPAIFTSQDDSSVGAGIVGAAGSPSGYYGSPALSIATGTNNILQHLHFRHASTAVEFLNSTNTLSHAQFVNCLVGVSPTNSRVALRNVLMANCASNIVGGPFSVSGEHLTVNTSDTFAADTTASSSPVSLTNSILAFATNLSSGVALTTNFVVISNSASIFQTVGAGSHYLENGSSLRNAGTVDINPTLLTELKTRTTYPPSLWTNQFLGNTTISTNVERDVSGPDLGYHYDPIDYAFVNQRLTNHTVTVTNGAALAFYATNFASGFYLVNGAAKLISEGTANAMNRFVWYNTVQEQANTNWIFTPAATINYTGDTNTNPLTVKFKHTQFSRLSEGSGFHMARAVRAGGDWIFEHCQFHGSLIEIFSATNLNVIPPMTWSITNCLFDGTQLTFNGGVTNLTVYAQNNLFYRGQLTFGAQDTNLTLFAFTNNFFDQNNIVQSITNSIYADYNGYLTNQDRLISLGANDLVLTNASFVYTNGPLGFFYHGIASLVDEGVGIGTPSGLFHFTMQREIGSREGSTTLDIGFHYAEIDGSGIQVDNDAPVLTVPGSQSVNANSSLLFTNLSIADVDVGSGDMQMCLFVTNGTLTLGTTSGLTFTAGTNAFTTNLTVIGTLASLTNALTNLTYQPFTSYFGPDRLCITISDLQTNTVNGAKADAECIDIVVIDDSPTVATPIFSSATTNFVQPLVVTITCSTPGASIYYTTNGSTPTTSDLSIVSGGTVTLTGTTLLKARGFKTTWTSSEVRSNQYYRVDIAAGERHMLILMPDSTLISFGDNSEGQLGIGIASSLLLNRVLVLSNVISIAAGKEHSLAVKADGIVWKWGHDVDEPTQVSSLSNVISVAAGGQSSFAIKSDGTVWAWGGNQRGQLGIGNQDFQATPVQIEDLEDIVAISSSETHTLAVDSSGSVWAWGNNIHGQLGDGSTNDHFTPIQVPDITGIVDVVAAGTVVQGSGESDCHSLALQEDGSVWAWGANYVGQLGDGSTNDSHSPIQLTALDNITSLKGNEIRFLGDPRPYNLALSNSMVYAWGDNSFGQVGDESDWQADPVIVDGPEKIIGIAAGGRQAAALAHDMSLWLWGTPINTLTSNSIPAKISVFDTNYYYIPCLQISTEALEYFEGFAPFIIDTNANICDGQDLEFNLEGATLTVDFVSHGQEGDHFNINHEGSGTGQIGISDTNISYSAIQIANFETNDAQLIVRFNSAATTPAIRKLLRNINFSSENPASPFRSARFSFVLAHGNVCVPSTIPFINPSYTPSFILLNQEVVTFQNTGATNIIAFAQSISQWSDEFVVLTNDNPSLFSNSVEVAIDGTLSFATASNANGTAHIDLQLNYLDRININKGGTSVVHSFTIYSLSTNLPQIAAEAVSGGDVIVLWDEEIPEAPVVYIVERRLGTNDYSVVAEVLGGRFVDTGLTPETAYFYRMYRKFDPSADPYSNEVEVHTMATQTPFAFDKIVLWLRAQDVPNQISGEELETWPDFWNPDISAEQSTLVDQPTLVTNAFGTTNSAVRFGNGSYLNLPNVTANKDEAEIFIVLRSATNTPATHQGLWKFGTGGACYFPKTDGSVQDSFGSTSARQSIAPLPVLTNACIYNVAASSSIWRQRLNGPIKQLSEANTVSFSGTPLLGRSANGASEPFEGEVAELLIFDSVLSLEEQKTIRDYLAAKYSVTLSLPVLPSDLLATNISLSTNCVRWTPYVGSESGLESYFVIERNVVDAFVTRGEISRTNTLFDDFVNPFVVFSTDYSYRLRVINDVGETVSDPLEVIIPDADGDGLSDHWENSIGTDANDDDSDGDGLPDGWELAYGLDPNEDANNQGAAGDPDGDGISNLQEYLNGGDPTDGVNGDQQLLRVFSPRNSPRQ